LKLAISNIAWDAEEDQPVFELMREAGFDGVEIAPTKVWDRPLEANEEEVSRYRRFWNERGIEVVALQALLFGRPGLQLFGSHETRTRTLAYLRGMMRLAEWLGARVLVFGAPKNRQVGERDPAEAREIAVDFFRRAGADARSHGVVLAIEPNPAAYACDFVTTSREGKELVEEVGDEGFGLHLDAAAMTLAGEDLTTALGACGGTIAHFHASEPNLGLVGSGPVDHETMASGLRRTGYSGWVSVEMRPPEGEETKSAVRRVLSFVRRVYGGRADS
jgi:sugar phosphate isomerase/epimerase